MNSRELLERLVAFPTVSRDSNLALIEFVEAFLEARGIACQLYRDRSQPKANLVATIGPRDVGGILLSGHTDVVPVDGQAWSSDPFVVAERSGRLYARGAADMKGFLASALAAAARVADKPLRVPLHLALSYDEEIGCVGVRSLIEAVGAWAHRPRWCLVGEPTQLRIAIGHKGKTALRATCIGHAAHSAVPAQGVNAIYLASGFVSRLQGRQQEIERGGACDHAYEVPFTTVHVGVVRGGTALNIVPSRCELEFEIRNVAAYDPTQLMALLREDASSVAREHARPGCQSAIELEVLNEYPGLETPANADVVGLVAAALGDRETVKVAFGSEAGLFSSRLGVPTVVCGPGSIDQAHKADEFLTVDQLLRCDAMMDALVQRLR